jgi:hypothetical protein
MACEEAAFRRQHSAVSENQNQHQKQRTFTAKDAKGAKEEEIIPQMDADERGLENRIKPIEWKPTADMCRMDTREGMEAYEASFGTKIKPRVAGESRPLQGLAQPGAPLPQHQERFTAKDAQPPQQAKTGLPPQPAKTARSGDPGHVKKSGLVGQTHANLGCGGMNGEGVGRATRA